MSVSLKDLEKMVVNGNDPQQSAEILVNGLADQLDGLTHDPVAIWRLATELRDNAVSLGKAITAHPAPSVATQSAKPDDVDKPHTDIGRKSIHKPSAAKRK